MSGFDEMFDDWELDRHDFEIWLDSINESGNPELDEEYYNKVMDEVNRETFSQEIGENMDREEEIASTKVEWPEVVVNSENYSMIISNN
tara:strand:+ start:1606 stop:1872 length:267 start_codon:yes stop_codon:yes gene_type:complete